MADMDTTTVDGEGAGNQMIDASADASTDNTPDLAKEVEKWKALSRKHEAQAKANAAAAKRLAEIENSNKSELERLEAAAAEAQKRAEAAESRVLKYEVALRKGVPQKLMKFLTGATEEELEASADELLEALGGTSGAADSGKPKEKLRPGAAPEGTEETVPLKDVLAAIPRA